MIGHLSRVALLHLHPRSSSTEPARPLARAVESLAILVAAALTAADAHAQGRVTPLLVANPSGADLSPIQGLVDAQVALGLAPARIAALLHYQAFSPVSAVTLDFTAIATGGPSGFTTVAQSSPGQVFTSVAANASGDAVFTDQTAADGQHILKQFPDGRVLPLVYTGLTLGTNLRLGEILPGLRINDRNEILFSARLQRPTFADDRGFFFTPADAPAVSTVARTGTAAPGFASGELFYLDQNARALLNNQGRIALGTGFTRGDAFNPVGTAIWTGPLAALSLAIASGQAPVGPNPGNGAIIDEVRLIDQNDRGDIAVAQTLSQGWRSLLVGPPSNLQVVVSTGQDLPGLFGPQRVWAFGSTAFSLNGRGHAAFGAEITPSDPFLSPSFGIWRFIDGEISTVVLAGQLIQPNARLRSVQDLSRRFQPILDDFDNVSFLALVRAPDNDGLFTIQEWLFTSGPAGPVRPLLRKGELIPVPDGTLQPIASFNALGTPDPQGNFTVNVTLANTATAILLVNPRFCPADFDASGAVDPDDLASFITAFFSTPPDPRADFDRSGAIDPEDLSSFLSAYFSPC